MGSFSRYRWESWRSDSIEELFLKEYSGAIVAESTIISHGKNSFVAKYIVACDIDWRTKKFIISLQLSGERKSLWLKADGTGIWSANTTVADRLKGAIDVDLTATPFTNTLPIRRLQLKEHQSKEILVAYVSVPELNVSVRKQRYTCSIAGKRYHFEQLDDNFVSDIEVDGNGLVLIYPGLFKRLRE